MRNKNNDENKSELTIFTNEEFGDVRTTGIVKKSVVV